MLPDKAGVVSEACNQWMVFQINIVPPLGITLPCSPHFGTSESSSHITSIYYFVMGLQIASKSSNRHVILASLSVFVSPGTPLRITGAVEAIL